LLRKGTENKYEQPYSGPHTVKQVNNNGTVKLQMGSLIDTVNIRRIEPTSLDTIHGGRCNRQSMRVKTKVQSTDKRQSKRAKKVTFAPR